VSRNTIIRDPFKLLYDGSGRIWTVLPALIRLSPCGNEEYMVGNLYALKSLGL
jgi:hypothetical protein